MRAHAREARREKILELVRAAVDAGRLEEPARRERLQRLDEAAVRGVLEEALDRPWPGFREDLGMRLVAFVPEAERGTEGEEARCEEIEHHGLRRRGRECAVTIKTTRRCPREHRVGRAEVQAQRTHSGQRTVLIPADWYCSFSCFSISPIDFFSSAPGRKLSSSWLSATYFFHESVLRSDAKRFSQ